MFVLGPQHTWSVADRIVRFARDSRIESFQVSLLTPFPGTPLFTDTRDNLLFQNFPHDWDYYDGTHCVYRQSRLGLEGLQQALLRAHKMFYRWGGWNLRRAHALLKDRQALRDKLANLWNNARIARQTLRNCRQENESFLDVALRKLKEAERTQLERGDGP